MQIDSVPDTAPFRFIPLVVTDVVEVDDGRGVLALSEGEMGGWRGGLRVAQEDMLQAHSELGFDRDMSIGVDWRRGDCSLAVPVLFDGQAAWETQLRFFHDGKLSGCVENRRVHRIPR